MIIKFKCVSSVLLMFIFVMGLVQKTMVTYFDDTSIVMELEHHDSPNDSEPDIDEDVLDFDMIVVQTPLPLNRIQGSGYDIVYDVDCNIRTIKTSQPTPPPEYIG